MLGNAHAVDQNSGAGGGIDLGDVLELHYARKYLTVRVLHVPERVTPGLRNVELYEVLAERRDEPADWLG